ncbi:hypothetical protein Tco_0739352, partial [Tanacetum coccineum]
LGWHLEEIHVPWAQFGKKRDKIAALHDEGLKNLLQTVETASGFLATPSGLQCNGVKILATASEHSRLKETLDDLASQDKDDYSTCARSTKYCFDHNSFIRTRILMIHQPTQS